VPAFDGLKKFKMAAVAMVTKVQKMLNSLQTSHNGRHFELFQPPQNLPHTTVDIPTKFHEA
jgi:hypothetical protein